MGRVGGPEEGVGSAPRAMCYIGKASGWQALWTIVGLVTEQGW